MGHDRLANHFKTQFGMIQHHKWSMEELEAMMPWERYIYVDLLENHIKEEEKKQRKRKFNEERNETRKRKEKKRT